MNKYKTYERRKQMNLTRGEKQDKINSTVKYIAYNVFMRKGDFKFADAYNKLRGRVYLDWGISIDKRLKESVDKDKDMYSVLSGDELDKVLKSCDNLLELYKNVIEIKVS